MDNGSILISIHASDSSAELSVHDNGSGIDKEHLDKIWEPFYSTKGDKGAGLGLDISKRIIEDHNGEITCSSRPEQGTEFIIQLPLPDGSEVD